MAEVLIAAHQIRKSFGARPLFEGLTFSIEAGERIGLIGPNGAGKSTLMRVLAQETTPDEGTISFRRGLKVGYLEQVPHFEPGNTILSAILGDDWDRLQRAQEYISRLGLDGPAGGAEAEVERLSGGWKKRVALARELVKEPDLLLLDEPTNHLDVESILWLEEFLAGARFATLTVTHDRLFLQRVSNRILELDRRNAGGILSVAGDYAAYLETKDALMAAQERREIILKNTLRRETEWLRRGAKARTTKQQARIQRAGELKDEVSELGTRNLVRTAKIDFQGTEKNPKRLIEARDFSKSYDGRKLFTDFDLLVTPGSRIGIIGPNGCGKSTLIRALLGREKPDTGTTFHSEHLKVAYFEQNRESLDPNLSLRETFCPKGDHVDFRGARMHVRGYLDRFLFGPEQIEMAVGKLSGGEQSRILIAKLMLQEANVLVLDEPTNDLDLATLNILEDCLRDFPGAVFLVTHDRYFLDQVATRILAFPIAPGQTELVSFAGLEQWEEWHIEQSRLAKDAERAGAKASAAASAAASGASAQKKRKLSYKDQRELDGIEEAIHKAEARRDELTTQSEDSALATNAIKLAELSRELSAAQAEVDRLYARWAELES